MMGWVRRLFGAEGGGRSRDPGDDFWYSPLAYVQAAAAGVYVTVARAMTVPTVSASLQVLADPVSTLPLMLFRRRADGSKERVDGHPLFPVLHDEPNATQTAPEFRGDMQVHLAAYGNAYAEIVPGSRGAIEQLVPFDPEDVTTRSTGGMTWFDFNDPTTGRKRSLRQDEVWHLKRAPLTNDGRFGQSPIMNGREAIGAAIALQDYAARYFANDGQSGGILEHPGHFKDVEQRKAFEESWRGARTAANVHKDRVLEFGIKYNRHAPNNEQAQFLDTRRQIQHEISQIWHIPPHKVGLLDRATNNNIEQQALEFVTDCLLPWLVIWERRIKRDLLFATPDIFAEFNVAGLLRGDLKTRYEAFAQARNWGWLSVNDIRALENMNPIEGGDEYLRPLNMEPVGAPAARRDDPRGGAWAMNAAGVWVPAVTHGDIGHA